MKIIVLIIGSLVLLNGCGKKGVLLPPASHEQKITPSHVSGDQGSEFDRYGKKND